MDSFLRLSLLMPAQRVLVAVVHAARVLQPAADVVPVLRQLLQLADAVQQVAAVAEPTTTR